MLDGDRRWFGWIIGMMDQWRERCDGSGMDEGQMVITLLDCDDHSVLIPIDERP